MSDTLSAEAIPEAAPIQIKMYVLIREDEDTWMDRRQFLGIYPSIEAAEQFLEENFPVPNKPPRWWHHEHKMPITSPMGGTETRHTYYGMLMEYNWGPFTIFSTVMRVPQ